jgi:hypothetical protein
MPRVTLYKIVPLRNGDIIRTSHECVMVKDHTTGNYTVIDVSNDNVQIDNMTPGFLAMLKERGMIRVYDDA